MLRENNSKYCSFKFQSELMFSLNIKLTTDQFHTDPVVLFSEGQIIQ
jgi:hypothetical protein